MDESLQKVTKEEVKEWIKEEWEELIKDGATYSEATSNIIDGNYKWMNIEPENEIFVYEELIKLNKEVNPIVRLLENKIVKAKQRL